MVIVLVNHEPTFEFAHSKPPPSQFPLALYFSTPCIFAYHFESSDAYVSFEKL
jgi:hypothetical protein